MTARGVMKTILIRAGLYRQARRLYERLRHPEHAKRCEALTALYGGLVRPGDLVFDVGANVGRHAEPLLHLGARVVALEPNPACAIDLRGYLACPKLTVCEVAIGAGHGDGILMICEQDHTMSSMSGDFIQTERSRIPWFSGFSWRRTIRVPVTTLDALIAEHGIPRYIKMDVEGYDYQAILGLSQPVAYLSFEFQPIAADLAVFSVRRLASLGFTEFNYTHGNTAELGFSQWQSEQQILAYLTSPERLSDKLFGDVFARCPRLIGEDG